jgi:hypothetical protein
MSIDVRKEYKEFKARRAVGFAEAGSSRPAAPSCPP